MTPMYNPAHPGRVLKSYLEGRSVTKVADHLGVARVTLSRVLNEQAAITPEMSLKLADALGTSPDMWFKMQSNFDFWRASRKRRKRIAPIGNVA